MYLWRLLQFPRSPKTCQSLLQLRVTFFATQTVNSRVRSGRFFSVVRVSTNVKTTPSLTFNTRPQLCAHSFFAGFAALSTSRWDTDRTELLRRSFEIPPRVATVNILSRDALSRRNISIAILSGAATEDSFQQWLVRLFPLQAVN